MSGNQNPQGGNNNQPRQQVEGMGCLGWVLEWAVFILGAVLMFAKTAELLSAFAPRSWLGYVGIESLYGMVSAIMVEGLVVAIKFSNDPVLSGKPKNIATWLTNIVIMIVPFAISLLAQPLDAFVIQGTLVNQPVEVQILVFWGVPMVPGLIMGLIMFKSVMENLPDEITSRFGMRPAGKGWQFPKVGNLGMLDFRKWFSDGNGHDKRKGERREEQQQKPPPKQEREKTEDPTKASTRN